MKRAPELMPIVNKALSAEVDTDAEFQQILTDLAPLYCYNYKQFANKLSEATKDIVPKAQAFRHSFRSLMPQYDVRDQLQKITVPVLIICGRHDWITPVSQSLIMHDKLPNSELVIFENSAHWVYIEEEALFLQTVNDWLDRT
jgi:proline iminopeptidase